MPSQPTVNTDGIKYIKINKQDFNGVNLNNQISELNALRIKYSNGTITQFNLIGTPSEYSDYYLLRVSPSSNFTSSADNNILNYTALGSKGFSSIPTSNSKITGFTVSSNPGGYFNGTTGNYTVPNLTNISIRITGSFQVEETAGSNADVELELVSSVQGTLATDSVTLGAFGVDTLLVQYQGTFTEDELIYFNWVRQGSADNTGVSSIVFTQSRAENSPSENLVVFEPYNITNIYNSDYNAIINDVEISRPSTDYLLVDYSTNQNIPVNFEQLINGTATPASIPDSNFTSYQFSGIRYIGSKNTTDNFNTSSLNNVKAIETSNNVQLGPTTLGAPSVDINSTYFAYFNWAGGTAPEWGDYKTDKTSYNLRYFVTEQGSVIKPTNDSSGVNLGIITQNFVENTNAISTLNNTNLFGTELGILNGKFNIFKSGKTIQPILYNQLSTYDNNGNTIGYTFTGSISFGIPVGTTPITDWGFQYSRGATQQTINYNASLPAKIDFNTLGYDAGPRYNTSNDYYEFDADTDTPIAFFTTIKLDNDYAEWDPFIYPNQQLGVGVAIQYQPNGSSTWTNLAGATFVFGSTSGILTRNIGVSARNYDNGDRVRVAITFISAQGGPPFPAPYSIYVEPTSFFTLNQSQASGLTQPTASGVFWTTGSTPDSVLTASEELTALYGFTQQSIYNSGFNGISYPFIPQPYDEIRFEAVEAQAYKIQNVELGNRLYLFLEGNLNGQPNIDQFLIRKYVDDPAYIILDVDKPQGDSGEGVLKPEYLLDRIDNNVNTILEQLKEKNII